MYDGLLSMTALKDAVRRHNFVYLDTSKIDLSEYIIDYINQFADVLIVGRTGLYRQDAGHQYIINENNINYIKKPIIFSSIEDYGQFENNKEPSSLDYKKLVSRSSLFSVESDTMSERLIKAGVSEDDIYVVPDVSMFVDSLDISHPIFNTDKIKVGIERVPMFSRYEYRCHEMIRGISSFAEQINEEAEIEVYSFGHISDPPTNVFEIFKKELLGVSEYSARFLSSLYKKMDFMVGCSAQSASLAIGAGVPFMGVGNDPSMRAILRDLDTHYIQRSLEPSVLAETFNDMMVNVEQYTQIIEMRREQCKFIKTWFAEQISNVIKGDR